MNGSSGRVGLNGDLRASKIVWDRLEVWPSLTKPSKRVRDERLSPALVLIREITAGRWLISFLEDVSAGDKVLM